MYFDTEESEGNPAEATEASHTTGSFDTVVANSATTSTGVTLLAGDETPRTHTNHDQSLLSSLLMCAYFNNSTVYCANYIYHARKRNNCNVRCRGRWIDGWTCGGWRCRRLAWFDCAMWQGVSI